MRLFSIQPTKSGLRQTSVQMTSLKSHLFLVVRHFLKSDSIMNPIGTAGSLFQLAFVVPLACGIGFKRFKDV